MNQDFLSEQVNAHGLSIEEVNRQLALFKSGTPFVKLQKAATVGDGIIQLNEQEQSHFVHLFDEKSNELTLLKFVPASGAASRMFRDLETLIGNNEQIDEEALSQNTKDAEAGKRFIENIHSFAFFDSLKNALSKKGFDIDELLKSKKYTDIFTTLLFQHGLNYSAFPKALIEFHRYENEVRTALEEHFIEGLNYGRSGNTVRLHFTIPPEFKNEITDITDKLVSKYETDSIQIEVTFSFQEPSTDTIAVDENNEPFIKDDGTILFRPGGHGALLQNLNQCDADLVFIKNIDNVVPDRLKSTTSLWKKVIAGKLVEVRSKIFEYLNQIDKGMIDGAEIKDFIKNDLCLDPVALGLDVNNTKDLKSVLNRPIRVCGMVENKGEPGGGPYFVVRKDAINKLQIVESSQMDLENEEQANIVQAATHFNPVDIVCMLRDYKGKQFDLNKFTNPETAFIANKSFEGRPLKALEHPGLWNGAMADWITIFIEVPISTFNPVKTVFDLLRESHQ